MKTRSGASFKIQKGVSALTVLIGVLLMVMKIYADSEPGAIPLLLVVGGSTWYFLTRSRIRTKQT